MRGIILGILLLMGLIACESEEDKQALEQMLVERELERRMTEYKRILDEKCMEEVFQEATRITDSLMIMEARQFKDTLLKPLKPLRPEKPEVKTLKDSIPVKPFLLNKNKRDTING